MQFPDPDYMKRIRHKAVGSIGWASLESAGGAIAAFASIFVLTRVLPPAIFGASALVIALVSIVEIMISAFFVDALVQRRSLSTAHVDAAFAAVCITSLSAAAVICGFSRTISLAYGDPALQLLFCVATASILFTGLSAVPAALLTRKLRMKQLAIRTLLGRCVSIGVTLGCALAGWGVWSFVLGTVAGNGLMAAFLWTRMARKPRLRFSWIRTVELLRFGVFSGIEQSLWLATSRVITAVVGLSHSHTEIGHLSFAMRFVETLQNLIGGVTSRLALPLFSGLQHDRTDLKQAFLTASRIAACVSTPVFFGVAVLSDVILATLFSPQWAPAAELITILAFAACGGQLFSFFGPYFKAIGRPELTLFGVVVTFVLATSGAMLSSGRGMTIAAGAYLARLLFTIPYCWAMMARVSNIGAGEHFRSIASSLLASGLATMLVFGVKLGSTPVLGPLTNLVLLGGLGAVSFLGAMLIIDGATVRQVLSIGRRVTTR